MAKIIGLTGGIGSGKTTIATEFRAQGIPVYIADDEARKVMESTEVITAIKASFGTEVFENDKVNREKLAAIVFTDKDKLALLNSIVHPAVKKDFQQWLLKYNEKPFVVYEAAILFESGSFKFCDWIITVVAPMETRITRVINRDKTTREQVMQRIKMQWSDEQRVSKSDFVITNNTIDETKEQIVKILKILKKKQNVS